MCIRDRIQTETAHRGALTDEIIAYRNLLAVIAFDTALATVTGFRRKDVIAFVDDLDGLTSTQFTELYEGLAYGDITLLSEYFIQPGVAQPVPGIPSSDVATAEVEASASGTIVTPAPDAETSDPVTAGQAGSSAPGSLPASDAAPGQVAQVPTTTGQSDETIPRVTPPPAVKAVRVVSPERGMAIHRLIMALFSTDHSVRVSGLTDQVNNTREPTDKAFTPQEIRATIANLATSEDIKLSHNQKVVSHPLEYDNAFLRVNKVANDHIDLLKTFVANHTLGDVADKNNDADVKRKLVTWLIGRGETYAGRLRTRVDDFGRSDMVLFFHILLQLKNGSYRTPQAASVFSELLAKYQGR